MTQKPDKKPEKETIRVTDLKLVHSDKRLLLPEGTQQPAPKPEIPPTDIDWLSPLAVGTEFVCQFSGDARTMCDVYTLNEKGAKSFELFTELNEPATYIRVTPERFCMFYDLVEVLHEPEPITE